jgi:hypothetical protein
MQKTFIKNERRIFNMKNVVALQEGHLRYGTDSIVTGRASTLKNYFIM